MAPNFTKLELAPGIYFEGDRGHYRVWLKTEEKELIGWDYEEICSSPQAWYDSLKTIALSIQSGPTSAITYVENVRKDLDPPLGSITCNICGEKFVVKDEHPFVFNETLNGNQYHDFQCSDFCHKQRRASIYEEEMGEDFLKLWNNKFLPR